VLWYGGSLVIAGKLTIGKLTAFLLYTIYVAMALGGLSSLFSTIMSAIGASERVFELFDREPAINLQGGVVPTHAMRGEVHFKGVVFAYPSRPDVTVLNGFELEVRSHIVCGADM
jgi:ATP-binding cassette subfamily B protein